MCVLVYKSVFINTLNFFKLAAKVLFYLLMDFGGLSCFYLEKWNVHTDSLRSLEQWNVGTVECWKNGMLEKWNVGTVECWNNGMLEQWNVGIMECWNNGMLEQRSAELN